MVLCKDFQEGRCKIIFQKCPNEHVNIKYLIQEDVKEATKGNLWPLSSYGPFACKPSIPNFIEDQSFEEVRMLFYETKLKNFFGENRHKFNKDASEARAKMKSLLEIPRNILDVVTGLYDAHSNKNNIVEVKSINVPNTFGMRNHGRARVDSKFSNITYNIFEKNRELKAKSKGTSPTFQNSPPFSFNQQTNIFNFGQNPKPAKFIFGDNDNSTKECNTVKKSNGKEIPFKFEGLLVTDNKWPDDHCISKKIDRSIIDLVIVEMLPYNIVEGAAFKRIKFANPTLPSQYKRKSEIFLRTSLMPETFNKVKEKVVAMIEGAKWISLTIDIWNSSNHSSLINFTAHFLEGSLRKMIVLGANVLKNDNKNDEYIKGKLAEIIKNFKLEEKVHVVVYEGAQNMGENIKFGNLKLLECAAHSIQLLIHDAILKKKDLQDVINKACELSYSISHENSQTLPERNSLDDKGWVSSYLIMDDLIKKRFAAELFCSLNKKDYMSSDEWDLLNNIVKVLETFYEATTDFTADHASVSLIIPVFVLLISKMDEDGGAERHLKHDLKQALNEKFKFIENSSFLIIATLLDPRFKNKYLNEAQNRIAEKEMFDFLGETDEIVKSTNLKPKNGRTFKNTLWEKHDSMASSTDINDNDTPSKKELSLYLREPLKPRNSSLYEYWHRSSYVNLKKVAVKYLSAPPTSTGSNHIFSESGRLYTDRKANLTGINLEEFLFCHYNIKLLHFDY